MPRQRDDRRDRDLLKDLAAGKPRALGELYDLHARSLFRHAYVLCRQRDDAEDLVHAAFVKLATMGAELLGVRHPASYLHRMLHTTWLDGYRRSITGERVIAHIAVETDWTPAHAESIDIARALDGLPPDQREVVVLHAIEGFSFREIGKLTDVSMFTAAARYRLAIGKMRARLTTRKGSAT